MTTRPLVDQGPELDYTPDEDGGVVHYAPGDRPLCRDESATAMYTDDPTGVTGCKDCLELVEEHLQDENGCLGRCLHCRQEITAQGGVEWRRVVRRSCPHYGQGLLIVRPRRPQWPPPHPTPRYPLEATTSVALGTSPSAWTIKRPWHCGKPRATAF